MSETPKKSTVIPGTGQHLAQPEDFEMSENEQSARGNLLMVSTPKKTSVFTTWNTFLILFSVVGIYGVIARKFGSFSYVTFGIVLMPLLMFLRYTLRNKTGKWEFYDDRIEISGIWMAGKKIIPYDKITAFQVRYEMPKKSLIEVLPASREMCIWVEHQLTNTLSDSEYKNFDELCNCLRAQMLRYGMEEAPYTNR